MRKLEDGGEMVERIGEACGFAVDCKSGVQGSRLRCVQNGGIVGGGGAARCAECCGSSRVSSPRRPMPKARYVLVCSFMCSCAKATRVLARQGMQGWATAQQSAGRCAGAVQGLETRGKLGALRCNVIKEVAAARWCAVRACVACCVKQPAGQAAI